MSTEQPNTPAFESRRFESGRQSEQFWNEELYEIYLTLKNLLDKPENSVIGPQTSKEGALWLDRDNGGLLKYNDGGSWKVVSEDKFRFVSEILNPTEPTSNLIGQLWLDNGVLKYNDGSNWIPIKAASIDTAFNLSAFEQFLLISPLEISGDTVVDISDPDNLVNKYQFLLPSTELDKFFIDGLHIHDYDKIGKVTIQYPAEGLQGKTASAIHINPEKLQSIKKRIIVINKTNPIIPVLENNTEFYGISGNVGKLLIKTDDIITTQYKSIAKGIQLINGTDAQYDFVLAVTYKFGETRLKGTLSKQQIKLGGTNSVFIGTSTDPFVVFVQGLYLEETPLNYIYDKTNGYLNFQINTGLEISVIAFRTKEIGIITAVQEATSEGIITLSGNKTFEKPLVFVGGVNVEKSLADFRTEGDKIYVLNAKAGMSYCVVDTNGADSPENNAFIKSGIVSIPSAGHATSIPCTLEELSSSEQAILLIDGILIGQNDITRDIDGNLLINGLQANQEYTLLKEVQGRVLFNDVVNFSTIPTQLMDASMVYVQNQLISESSAVFATALPEKGVEGEVKLILQHNKNTWYLFSDNHWNELDDVENADLISNLNSASLGYTTSRHSVSLLQDFQDQECTIYSYRYANTIERPLLFKQLIAEEDQVDLKLHFTHGYQPGVNSLAVWKNGVRQYDIDEETSRTFTLPSDESEGDEPFSNIFYTVEPLEKQESKACEREILDNNNKITGTMNVYSTNIPMYPGIVKVFIGGLRQPPFSYKIIDPYTIRIVEDITTATEQTDKIMIEVRQDYQLKELTLPIAYAGQREWNTYKDKIPLSLIETGDFVMIYINGQAYGDEYTINKATNAITLTNRNITDRLGIDPIRQHFNQYPEKYIEWKQKNNKKEYPFFDRTDYITFEWR